MRCVAQEVRTRQRNTREDSYEEWTHESERHHDSEEGRTGTGNCNRAGYGPRIRKVSSKRRHSLSFLYFLPYNPEIRDTARMRSRWREGSLSCEPASSEAMEMSALLLAWASSALIREFIL